MRDFQYINSDYFHRNHTTAIPPQQLHLQFNAFIKQQKLKMDSKFATILVLVILAFSMSNLFLNVDATYRKPPFNGSIFGKRGTVVAEYDSAGKTLSAMCEIASEACQTWFPSQEK